MVMLAGGSPFWKTRYTRCLEAGLIDVLRTVETLERADPDGSLVPVRDEVVAIAERSFRGRAVWRREMRLEAALNHAVAATQLAVMHDSGRRSAVRDEVVAVCIQGLGIDTSWIDG
jgi:hypothetical protein